jgi:hypothetical protein
MSAVLFAQAAPPLSLNTPGLSTPILVGDGPAATVFNGVEYVAFQAHDSSNALWLAHSTDNQNFTAVRFSNITTPNGPAIAVFNNKLYIAYLANLSVYIITSSDGSTFSAPYQLEYYNDNDPVRATGQPAIAANNGKLYIAWEDDGTGSYTYVESVVSTDGVTFTSSGSAVAGDSPDGAEPQTGASFGMTSFNNLLYYAFQAQGNWGHEIVICHVSTSNQDVCSNYPSLTTHSGIAAGVVNDALYFAFKDPTSDNYLRMTGSEDGFNFTTPATSYSGARINGNLEIAPAIDIFNGHLNVFFVSNDSNHNLDLVHN